MDTSSSAARHPGSRLPTACRNGRRSLPKSGLALALALAVAGCGPSGTPEDEIRTLVNEAETAAEERDSTALRGLVADDYQDARGRGAADIRNFLHAWLIAHPSVNLITRIDSIELEGTELARLEVTVGMLGREANPDSNWDLAADIERLDIRLAREGREWRVIAASRQDGG